MARTLKTSAAHQDNRIAPKHGPWLLTLAACFACGMAALVLGQDANWDLRNYHYYAPYAFFHGRMDVDVAPAHVATFYNPLLHLPFYLMVNTLPPKVVGFILGAVQGLNFFLLLTIARRCLKPARTASVDWGSTAVAALGLTGAMTVSEIGTSYGDNVLSLLILGSLSLLFAAIDHPRPLRRAAAAGILAGAAVGLKLPMAAHGVGLAAACLMLPFSMGRRLHTLVWFGLGGLLGVALSDGFWLWEMQKRFGNPLFPYFNHIFQSPWAAAADYRDPRFLADTWEKLLLSPLRASFYPGAAAEVAYIEPRLTVVFVLALLWPAFRLANGLLMRPRQGASSLSQMPGAGLVMIYGAAAWLIWAKLFGVYRYMVPLEMLLPLAVVLLLDRLPLSPRSRGAAAAGLLVFSLVLTRPAQWERVPWADDYFGVNLPVLQDPDRTLVLMAGQDATAFIIPFFPPPVRFVRIQGYFTGPTDNPSLYDRRIKEAVIGHRGPAYAVFRGRWESREAAKALASYGLGIDQAACQPLLTRLDRFLQEPLTFCRVAPLLADPVIRPRDLLRVP
jgi:hypothetical protein